MVDNVSHNQTKEYKPRPEPAGQPAPQNETVAAGETGAPAGDTRALPSIISRRKLIQVVSFLTMLLEMLIGFRIFLKLIAANPQSGFAMFIYGLSAPFLLPFAGLTATPSAAGAVLEVSSIIAMIVYAILGWLAIYLIHLIWDR